jgi:hypothetical protein
VFDVPVTIAANACRPVAGTEALVGLTLSATLAPETRVTLAEADFVGSAILVAVTLTVAVGGTLGGGA